MPEREEFIQVGFTALRGPDGKFLPAVPLYIRNECGAEESRQQMIDGFAHLLALRMREYVEGCREAGVSV